MKRCIAGILAVALVSLGLAAGAYAQATKDEATGLDRLEGTVLSIYKEKSEIRIRQRKTTGMEWTVVYTPETKFTNRNAEGRFEDIKEGVRVICVGSFAPDKVKLTAQRIDVRTEK